MKALQSYFLIRYREDVTGISEAHIIAEGFKSLSEAERYCVAHPQDLKSENPYFVHLAEQKADGHLYLLGDNQIVYL